MVDPIVIVNSSSVSDPGPATVPAVWAIEAARQVGPVVVFVPIGPTRGETVAAARHVEQAHGAMS